MHLVRQAFIKHIPLEAGVKQNAFIYCLDQLIFHEHLYTATDSVRLFSALFKRIKVKKYPSAELQTLFLRFIHSDQFWKIDEPLMKKNLFLLWQEAPKPNDDLQT